MQETAKVNSKISYVTADLTKDSDVQKVIDYVKTNFGKLNTLVNNADWCPVQPMSDMTIKDYDRTFSIDVRAAVALMIGFLPLLKQSKGNISNMSSVATERPAANFTMYTGAKAAIEGISNALAREEGSDQVRVNIISPGPINTEIWYKTDMFREEEEKNKQTMAKLVSLARIGDPEDIANMALYLASDKAKFVTGANMVVDGGEGL